MLDKQKESEERRLKDMIRFREAPIAKFNEGEDIENYLTTFERVAQTYEWPVDTWVIKLIPHLTGKAQAAYAAMDITESKNYGRVKEAILKRFDITDETYRQRFRAIKKMPNESYGEVYVRLKDMFNKWAKPGSKNVDQLAEILVMEQLVGIMPTGVQIWVKEHRPDTGTKAASLADDYFDARKGLPAQSKNFGKNQGSRPTGAYRNEKDRGSNSNTEGKDSSKSTDTKSEFQSDTRPPLICRRCKKPGHIERFCRAEKKTYLTEKIDRELVPQSYECRGLVDGRETDVLLDSGCDMTLVHSELVDKQNVNQHKEAQVTYRCVHDHWKSYPTALVNIRVGEEDHRVLVGVSQNLPKGVILGRDFPNFGGLLKLRERVDGRKDSMVMTRAQVRKERDREKMEARAEIDCGVVPRKVEDIP
jgi:hypothetical protein